MQYDYSVFIGRFQPIHNGHMAVIREGLKISNTVILLVGSSYAARNVKNPFTFSERKKLIEDALSPSERDRVVIEPLRDYYYNDQPWIAEVQGIVEQIAEDGTVCMLHPYKDESSYYLKLFPQWNTVNISITSDISATDVRYRLFNGYSVTNVPVNVIYFVSSDEFSECLSSLREEYDFINEYKKQYKDLKYPPIFVTTDAVTICNGHILLVERKAQPGKGLMALPGGFIRDTERLEDSMLRELKEETRIAVPKKVLAGSITKSRVFDNPNRSLRGRTITHAYLIELENEVKLPKVKGSDDAANAKWVTIRNFLRMEEEMYEDHFHIVMVMLGITNS